MYKNKVMIDTNICLLVELDENISRIAAELRVL